MHCSSCGESNIAEAYCPEHAAELNEKEANLTTASARLRQELAELRGHWAQDYFAKLIAGNPKPNDFTGGEEAWAKWLCTMYKPMTHAEFWHFCQQQQEDEFNHDTWEN